MHAKAKAKESYAVLCPDVRIGNSGHGAAPGNVRQTSFRYFPVAKRDRDWGLFITTTGKSRFGAGTPYPPEGHPKGYDFRAPEGRQLDEFQIIYISAGSGWFKSEASGRTRVNAGTVIMLFPRVWHSYAPTAATGWDEHWVGFNGYLAKRLVRHGFFNPKQPVLHAGVEDKLLSLCGHIVEAAHSKNSALQQIMAGYTENMLALLYSARHTQLTGDDPALDIIHKAIDRMREASETPLHVPDLADELKVSYRWFRRAFTHHTGLSPHHYYIELRLARARDLLAQSCLSIKEIATRVGFEDPQYFSKFFHKKTGMAASVWRERAKANALSATSGKPGA